MLLAPEQVAAARQKPGTPSELVQESFFAAVLGPNGLASAPVRTVRKAHMVDMVDILGRCMFAMAKARQTGECGN